MRVPLNNPPQPSLKFGVPGWGKFGKHAGIDWPVATGTRVYAPAAGTIRSAITASDGTKVLEIAIGNYWHRFLHLESFVKTAGTVSDGELIGFSGATGPVTGPHLHWDVRKAGTTWDAAYSNYIDPFSLITEEGEDEVKATDEQIIATINYLHQLTFDEPASDKVRQDQTPLLRSNYLTGIQTILESYNKHGDALKNKPTSVQPTPAQVGTVYKALTGSDISQKDLDFYITSPRTMTDLVYGLMPGVIAVRIELQEVKKTDPVKRLEEAKALAEQIKQL